MKYSVLLNVLDKIRSEAPSSMAKTYNPGAENVEAINYARSRSFIHLYLKVSFGILDFMDRERFITDKSYDGGIDGYYIEKETKIIYFIQSKFRNTSINFESKDISLSEIIVMDIGRVLDGEVCDECGNPYNGKIKQLQREVSELHDVARYSYKVIILANLSGVTDGQMKKLTGGFYSEIFDYNKSYNELVFPVISGTYFTASEINIPIDLSNKYAGSKISYSVSTSISECEITVLFAPTIEIAKLMSKYKNSILKYNPRSYLEHDGKAINTSIRETIINSDANEFALYNNGITILSDETNINERIGQKNKAQLRIKNPQIINGGQTSYTLSRIYDEYKSNDAEGIFKDKEVLLKIITLMDDINDLDKIKLISEISNATNKQTPVINADKFSNDDIHKKIQKIVFDKFGILYERKRGEFSDGLANGYINKQQVLERNLFFRIYYSSNGYINIGFQKKLFQQNDFSFFKFDDIYFDRFYIGYHLYLKMYGNVVNQKGDHDTYLIRKDLYAKLYAYNQIFPEAKVTDIDENNVIFESAWKNFLEDKFEKRAELKTIKNKGNPYEKMIFNAHRYFRSSTFERDVIDWFKSDK